NTACAVEICMRQCNCKLLSTETAEQIVRAQHAGAYGSELLEHCIADRVTIKIVDAREVVDVEHQQTQAFIVAASTGKLGLQARQEGSTTANPRQHIGIGQLRQ